MEDVKFKPTIEWMVQKYDELNQELFEGELGHCDFELFTSGKGSGGRTLGKFSMRGENLRYNRSDRQIFQEHYDGTRTYINRSNFVAICIPYISLNRNYSGIESSWLSTLVHEMCHYYVEMRGFVPKQAHGVEFREIAASVAIRSNGRFNIQRLATAEEMQGYELDTEYKEKIAQRKINTLSRTIILLIYYKDGSVRLVRTTNQQLVRDISHIEENEPQVYKILMSTDTTLNHEIYNSGYKHNMRTYRYWNVENEDFAKDTENKYHCHNIYTDYDYVDSNIKPSNNVTFIKKSEPTRVFSIKTNSGVFECPFKTEDELFYKLKERFPNMRDEVIQKIMDNPTNYKNSQEMNEHRRIKNIVERMVRKVINEKQQDTVYSITPDMNLGIAVPDQYTN